MEVPFFFSPIFSLCEIFVLSYFLAKQVTISLSDGIIANISRQYIDTRTQANLSKLNANRKQDLDIATEDIYNILERKRNSGKVIPPPQLFILILLIVCTKKTSYVTFWSHAHIL